MAEHASDTQARAFREAGPEDWLTDGDLADMHAAGELSVVTSEPTKTVEQYEAENWDFGRQGTKSLAEALAALVDRVDDPQAPDDDAEAYAELAEADYPGSP